MPFVVGAVGLLLSRSAYGRRHGQNVVVATFCIVVATAGILALRALFFLSPAWAVVSYPTPTLRARAVQAAFDQFMIGSAILGAVAGVGWVLFTHALQDTKGRVLLWSGLVWGVTINLAVYAYVRPIMMQAIARAFTWPGSYPPEINAAGVLVDALRLASLVAAVPTVLAYARAYSRVTNPSGPVGLAVKRRLGKSAP
ncbi:MAG TPA: hypothetical protein VI915_00330 [Thermoplasmata archaeon]|nr:hypothetical protein [Thermoplasmata archaeon]